MGLNLFRINEFTSEKNFETAELYLSQDGHHFVFVYKIEGKYFAQIQDKIFGGFDSIEDVAFRKNGNVFVFKFSNFSKMLGLIKEENQDFININGKIIGAFNKIRDFYFNENISYYIWYEYLGKSFVVINNQKYGYFKSVAKVYLSPEGSSFAIQYKEAIRHYIKSDGDVYGGYEEISNFSINYENKFFGFLFKKETGDYFANINSKVLGPFESCSDLHYYKEFDTYYFFYKQEGVNFVQINNFVFGGYDSYEILLINKKIVLISSTKIKEKETYHHIIVNGMGAFNNITEYAFSRDKEKYIFSYLKLGLFHVVTSDYGFGPYKKVSNLSVSQNGQNYCFVFQKQYDNYYVNINGDIYGPYILVSEVKIENSASNFGFIYSKNAKYFVNISNNLHGMYESASNLVLSDNGSGYSFKFSKRNKTGPLFAKLQTYLSLNEEIIEK
ncbi:MAG: hypothetical protein KKD38_06730, partial [Candidatus Delongbacteria bacterium]|nr:hypothetical protein [Candidatus Delongbacteria bacterium]